MGRRGCILVCRLVEFGLGWGICLIDELLNIDYNFCFFFKFGFFEIYRLGKICYLYYFSNREMMYKIQCLCKQLI